MLLNNSRPDLQAHCQSLTSQRYNQSFIKELAKTTQFAHRALGFVDVQKNKINLCFVDSIVRDETNMEIMTNKLINR